MDLRIARSQTARLPRGMLFGSFFDVTPMNAAVGRCNFVNSVDASAGTVDRLRTLNDYSGSPTQFTAAGWDNVTGLGSPSSSFLSLP